MLVEYNSRNRGFKNVCRIFFLLSFVLCLTKVMIYSKIGQKKNQVLYNKIEKMNEKTSMVFIHLSAY